MLIVTAFYLLTNFVVIGAVPRGTLASSSSPLIDATAAIFASPGILTAGAITVVGVGALLSITGADESGTIGTSRLAYAMSLDGFLPKAFSRRHGRFRTPYVGLTVLCAAAYVASLVGGLAALINASVFLLAVAYLATCLSAMRLAKRHPRIASELRGRIVVPLLGAAFCVLLIVLVDPLQIAVSVALFAAGIPVYVFFAPKVEIPELKEVFLSADEIRRRALRQATRFLAYTLHVLRSRLRRMRTQG